MKYASYILSILGIVLIFNIFLSYSSTSYRGFLKDTKTRIAGSENSAVLEKLTTTLIEEKARNISMNNDLGEKDKTIRELKDEIDKLQRQNVEKLDLTQTGVIDEPVSISGVVDKEVKLELPGTLLTKLMPEINPKKRQNDGVFSVKDDKFLSAFDYVTYTDFKKKITIYVFSKDYSAMLLNFKSANNFKINESDTFFGFTFYLNSIKKDQKVRFITLFEGVAVGFEVDKTNYEFLKKSILN